MGPKDRSRFFLVFSPRVPSDLFFGNLLVLLLEIPTRTTKFFFCIFPFGISSMISSRIQSKILSRASHGIPKKIHSGIAQKTPSRITSSILSGEYFTYKIPSVFFVSEFLQGFLQGCLTRLFSRFPQVFLFFFFIPMIPLEIPPEITPKVSSGSFFGVPSEIP